MAHIHHDIYCIHMIEIEIFYLRTEGEILHYLDFLVL